MNIGIIFHWGLYSVPAFCKVTKTTSLINNGSEWYLKRLMENKDSFRPTSGWRETQAFHEKNYKDMKYEDFSKYFAIDTWDPNEWMKLCVKIGASYVILTARHHDGFCLWDTKTTTYNSVISKCNKDLLNMFIISARKYKLRVGIYYSFMEFGKNCTKEYLTNVTEPQINELMTYNPDIWWFDGDWTCKSKFFESFISRICDHLKQRNPNVCINDRLGNSKELKTLKQNINFLGNATYRSYMDREIPKETPSVPWEHINTIGYSWGRNKMQKYSDYKTGQQLFDIYQKVRSKNGNLLLNLGPNADGTLDDIEVEKLLEFKYLLDSDNLEIIFED